MSDAPVQFRRVVLESRTDLPQQGEDREAELGGNRPEVAAGFVGLYEAAREITDAIFDTAGRWHGKENLPFESCVMNATAVGRPARRCFGNLP